MNGQGPLRAKCRRGQKHHEQEHHEALHHGEDQRHEEEDHQHHEGAFPDEDRWELWEEMVAKDKA